MTHIINYINNNLLVHFSQELSNIEIHIYNDKTDLTPVLSKEFKNTNYLKIPFSTKNTSCYIRIIAEQEIITKTIITN